MFQGCDTLKGKNVALIGGAGFVGHHLALALKKVGANPTIIDSLLVNNYYTLKYGSGVTWLATSVPGGTDGQMISFDVERATAIAKSRLLLLQKADVPLVVMDARDYHALSRVLSALEPDVMIQLAAVAHIDRANKDPFSTFDHSLRTLENALDFARGMKVAHFIYFSSSLVYGHFGAPVLTEEAPCVPFGVYGAIKLCGEHIVRAYSDVYHLPATIIRPCALYGPRCVSYRVLQKFVENALDGKPITINGTGESREDFTYIDDLVQGVLRVLINKRSFGETFNITAGQAQSLSNAAAIVADNVPGVEIKYAEADPMKPHRGTMSVDKARKMLGYEPQFNLSRGLEGYIKWYREFLYDEKNMG